MGCWFQRITRRRAAPNYGDNVYVYTFHLANDYVCNHDACLSFFATLPIRDMVNKDLQVLAGGAR
jgi:hypothetical protein